LLFSQIYPSSYNTCIHNKNNYIHVFALIFVAAATLIQDGVNPSCCDDKQRTPLHIAAAKGDEQMGM
jgi:ankyrin repeat protein